VCLYYLCSPLNFYLLVYSTESLNDTPYAVVRLSKIISLIEATEVPNSDLVIAHPVCFGVWIPMQQVQKIRFHKHMS
jgi:hypothetical protein